MNPFFSIIIPTHNAEKHLDQCLISCINQTFLDIEIIAIDDCSNDHSLQILQTFAKQDSRIKVIQNKENLGTFATRLIGGGGK